VILLFVLILSAAIAGSATAFASLRVPALDPASPQAAKPAARALERARNFGDRWRKFARDRVNHRVATGLLLTVTLVIVVLLGVLIVQVRADRGVVGFDRSAERWADGHATSFSNDVIGVITDFGGDALIVVITLAVAIAACMRSRNLRPVPFLFLVVAGQSLAANLIKTAVGRGRPAIGVLHGLDPSFPSGHSAAAAATFAACALVLGVARSRHTQAALTGSAVAIAVGVGASRVMLGVHWFSDVIAGLALGWAWFAIVALAFGGRLLRFGAPVELAERHEALVDAAS
jgi:membrane-associated phospholipid phosphatase